MKLKHSLLLAGFGTVLISALVLSKNAGAQAAAPIVMGYYPTYRDTPTPDKIRFDRFTHIIHSFITADADGNAVVPAAMSNSTLVPQAHAAGAKVILALSGGSNGVNFGKMVRDEAKRAPFIREVVAIMVASQADGLALDWEQPEAGDKAVTVEFVTQLRTQMKAAKADSLLMLVVNSSPGNSRGYDGPKLRDQVDFLHVMSYDFHGPWNHAGHHASLFESTVSPKDGAGFSYPAALTYWRDTQGFRPQQILLGIAGYGRGFKVRAWGEKPVAPSQYPEVTFTDARALVGRGWTRHWDAEANAPWLLKDDGSDRISYDDEQSVADKARWMKSSGLPGFFIWEIGQEYANGDFVLTATGQKAWQDAPAAPQPNGAAAGK